MAKQWYVIHTQTGWEEKVRASLEKRVKQNSKEEMISQILVPTEKVAEIREGKKKITQRKFFPGYILLEMDLNDDTWYLVKNTPGVSGFIGPRARPVPLKEDEIKAILKHTEEAQEKPMPKILVIEDDADMVAAIRMPLEANDYEVVAASSAEAKVALGTPLGEAASRTRCLRLPRESPSTPHLPA